jgi:nitroreductase
MNEIIAEIASRRARRAFDERVVAPEVLDRIFNAAILAPSCSNKQSWRFLVCSTAGPLAAARSALSSGNYWAAKAPVLVIVLTGDSLDCELSDERHYAQFDTGMATMNLMLQATREGLYAHPMAGFDPLVLREKFAIARDIRVMAMIALGYPGPVDQLNENHLASETSGRTRKPLAEVMAWEEWKGLVPA